LRQGDHTILNDITWASRAIRRATSRRISNELVVRAKEKEVLPVEPYVPFSNALGFTATFCLPVVAGVVIFVNELLPTRSDLELLRSEVRSGATDVLPVPGSEVERLLRAWRDRDEPPVFPLEFRLDRALRVVEVTPPSIGTALEAFDGVVARIEICRGKELQQGRVLSTWETNSSDESTCTACDSRTYCPDYRKERMPRLPGLRIRP
jgi:hypothetical protein